MGIEKLRNRAISDSSRIFKGIENYDFYKKIAGAEGAVIYVPPSNRSGKTKRNKDRKE